MKRYRFIIVLLLLLTACGGQTQNKEQMYLLVDGLRLRVLTLTEVEGNRLTGSQVEAFYDAPLSLTTPSEPHVVQNGAVGTLDNEKVHLTVGGVLSLDGTRTSTYLELTMLDSSSGMQVQRRWYAVSNGAYNTLLTTFKAHVKTRLKILSLNQLEEFLPADSDSGQVQFKVSGTKQEVDFLASAWNDVEQSDNHCQTLKERIIPFYPLPDNHFSLPKASDSTLAKSVGEVETAWKQAQQAKPPTLPKGVTLSWQFTQKDIDSALQPARQSLADLQQAITDQEPKMQQVQQEYQNLTAKIDPLKQSCNL